MKSMTRIYLIGGQDCIVSNTKNTKLSHRAINNRLHGGHQICFFFLLIKDKAEMPLLFINDITGGTKKSIHLAILGAIIGKGPPTRESSDKEQESDSSQSLVFNNDSLRNKSVKPHHFYVHVLPNKD
jgi:hypothetical protein